MKERNRIASIAYASIQKLLIARELWVNLFLFRMNNLSLKEISFRISAILSHRQVINIYSLHIKPETLRLLFNWKFLTKDMLFCKIHFASLQGREKKIVNHFANFFKGFDWKEFITCISWFPCALVTKILHTLTSKC